MSRLELEQYLQSPNLKRRLRYLHKRYRIIRPFDDFFQLYCLKIISGKCLSQTLDQFAIDVLRGEIGRNGSKIIKCKALESYDFPSDPDICAEIINLEEIEKLRGVPRALVILISKYGFTLKEVGYLFKVSESRISQLLKQAKKELKHEKLR